MIYNSVLIYCRELSPGTVSLTGDRAQGDDSKHDSHYTLYYTSLFLLKINDFYNVCLLTTKIFLSKGDFELGN